MLENFQYLILLIRCVTPLYIQLLLFLLHSENTVRISSMFFYVIRDLLYLYRIVWNFHRVSSISMLLVFILLWNDNNFTKFVYRCIRYYAEYVISQNKPFFLRKSHFGLVQNFFSLLVHSFPQNKNLVQQLLIKFTSSSHFFILENR